MTSAAFVRLTQHLLPKNFLSALVYRATRSRSPWLRRPLTRWFVRTYGVDLSEAADSDLDAYATFNDFFTRPLKPGARPIEGGANRLVSPSDGVLTELGTIDDDELFQAKGMAYKLGDLLGEDGAVVDALRGGRYFTIYLAPRDYHRVHSPIDGRLVRTRYIPGDRFSVSRATAAVIGRLFCRNERVICWFETAHGSLAVVLIGALNVSSISTFTRGEIQSGSPRVWDETNVFAPQGSEIGRFNMGSTVVVLGPLATLRWEACASTGGVVRMGQALATLGGG